MILPDKEQFDYKECEIAGDKCWLIVPKRVDIKWTDENSRFRSCIVRQSDNFVVSQGFRKFTNFGEQPDFEPWNYSWEFEAVHKLDGSLLIISKYKGEHIIRTRGTIDARQLSNGKEVDLLVEKYPLLFNSRVLDGGNSLLCEWTTPSNIIVLREHDNPTLTLVGMVYNNSAYYHPQYSLDVVAKRCGVERPVKYEYSTISKCISDVKAWKGKEGVVLYSPDGQILKKIKADAYLELHRLATGMTSIGQVLDVFLASPKFTKWEDFYKYVEVTLDYEIAEKCKPLIIQVCNAYKNVVDTQAAIDLMLKTNKIREATNRREQAEFIQRNFKKWEASLAFVSLDGGEVKEKLLKTAIESCL